MEELRELYPITEQLVYLNCAAVGPLALPVKRAIEKCAQDQLRHGNLKIIDEWV